MSYYIAKDKFGNYDLAHYGVKGMKWGETNEDPRLSGKSKWAQIGNSAMNQTRSGSSSTTNSSGSGSKGIWASGRGGSKMADESAAKATSPKVNTELVKEAVESNSETPKDDDTNKIAEANVAYQAALMNMQLLARISLGNGISPEANPEYLDARSKAIKAKYELDKLKNDQQKKAAENPPTMAEQRKTDDSNAKKQLAEDKNKEKKSYSTGETAERTTWSSKTNTRSADVSRGQRKDKPEGKKR